MTLKDRPQACVLAGMKCKELTDIGSDGSEMSCSGACRFHHPTSQYNWLILFQSWSASLSVCHSTQRALSASPVPRKRMSQQGLD